VGGVELLVRGAECGEGAVDGRRRWEDWAVGAVRAEGGPGGRRVVGADGAAVVTRS